MRRRSFLLASAVAAGAAWSPAWADPPAVNDPRATDGDDRFEPQWDERLTVTVGNRKADLVGQDDRVLQAAIDYVARLGGGTVKIQPGKFVLRAAVHLRSRVRLLGSGAETVITKIPSRTTKLADDSDWYDQEITLEDAAGFRVGDSVALRARNPHNNGQEVIKRTLVARSGKRFKLDDGLRKNLWLTGKPTCSSLFALLNSERTADVVVENMTLDGNAENNENLNGNYVGCIFLQDCNRYTIKNVTARNFNGDGISFQICHDVRVEGCRCEDNRGLGLHPGSGSQRPLMLNNQLRRNQLGLFWCWGVKYGLAEGNEIADNRNYGISIGHNDTDNVIRKNRISGSGKVGVLFRNDARGRDFWANRNALENNQIVNSGDADGVAIDIQGKTRDLRLVGNQLSESREPAKRIGIRIGEQAGAVRLASNQIQGFARDVVDLRG